MVNVTKENFVEQSNDLIQHLPTASFLSIDEEMTGISIPGSGRPPKEQPPSARYPVLKQAPERYAIIQLGISLFHYNNEAQETPWTVRRYNFYMFPADTPYARSEADFPREVVLNPGAVAFLHQHNMSFDLWTKEGICYQNSKQASQTIEKYIQTQHQELLNNDRQQQEKGRMSIQETIRRRVELRRLEDINFYARTMASVREWLDAAHVDVVVMGAAAGNHHNYLYNLAHAEAAGKTFLLPACNSFLRRALYEGIGKDYPDLDLESAGPDFPNQIRVWRLSAEERAVRKRGLQQEAWQSLLVDKLGMWRVFEAVSRVARGEELNTKSVLFAKSFEDIDWENPGEALDVDGDEYVGAPTLGRPVPVVVHNGFMDLCFLLTHFHARRLPDTLLQCKDLILSYFPTVYDTKILATECIRSTGNSNTEYSNLNFLFDQLVTHSSRPLTRNMMIAEGASPAVRADEVVGGDQEHEAAYDAYMTGCIFIQLCGQIQQESNPTSEYRDLHFVKREISHDEARAKYGCNTLYQMSMFTMDLENTKDPMSRGMTLDSTFRVANIDPSVTTRDVVRCLTDMRDNRGRSVNFDIIWVDDITFLVATRYRATTADQAAVPVEEEEEEEEEGEVAEEREPVSRQDETPEDILQVHGDMILNVLRGRFAGATITTLKKHMDSIKTKMPERHLSMFDRIMVSFGLKRRPSSEQLGSERPEKRRRLR